MINLAIKAILFQKSSHLNKLFGIVKNAKNSEDYINLGVGDPYFPSSTKIKNAGISAITENDTNYTPAAGTIRLRNKIAKSLKKEGLNYNPSSIVVSPGSKVLIPSILNLIVNEETDSAILPSPYYPPFLSAINSTCRSVIKIDTSKSNFQLTGKALEKAIKTSSNAKVLIINTPNNPTGTIYSQENLCSIAKVAIKNDLVIISDECYESYAFPGNEFTSIAKIPGMENRTIIIRSFSKKYNMCGWRIGFAAGPENLISSLSIYLGELVGCPSSISQRAAEAALETKNAELSEPRKVYRKNKQIVEKWAKKNGLKHAPIQGAFYAFIDFSPLFNEKIKDACDLAYFLLEEAQVVIAPGIDFGEEYKNFARLTLCSSTDKLELALSRIEKLFK